MTPHDPEFRPIKWSTLTLELSDGRRAKLLMSDVEGCLPTHPVWVEAIRELQRQLESRSLGLKP